MNFKEVLSDDLCIGYESKSSHFHFFFGNKFGSLPALKNTFPQYEFSLVDQVHGNHLVSPIKASSPTSQKKADGQWTTNSNLALCVRTADCLPILIGHPQQVAALHAGWRGLRNEIILKGLEHFFATTSLDQSSVFCIGPHIGPESFEVDSILAQELNVHFKSFLPLNTSNPLPSFVKESSVREDKSYLNLASYAQIQILNYFNKKKLLPPAQQSLYVSPVNTYINPEFHSFRRDSIKSGRLISFVVKS